MQPDGYLQYTDPDGKVSQIPWRIPRDTGIPLASPTKIPKPLSPASDSLANARSSAGSFHSQAAEIWQLVQDYSATYKIPIPPADAKACLDAIAEEKRKAGLPPPPPEPPRTVEEALGPKPMWGDPMFWDYWRKAKALGFVNEKKKKK